MKKFLCLPFLGSLLVAPTAVWAAYTPQTFTLPGPNMTIAGVLGNVLSWARAWIIPLTLTIFLLGAFWMIIFSASDTGVTQGKTMMKKAIIGMSIALMAFSIINVIFFILGI
jgi:hypothetical protein